MTALQAPGRAPWPLTPPEGGVVAFVSWLGGQLAVGLLGLVIMACFGLFIALAGGSETIRGLRGDGRDERFAQMDLRATAVALNRRQGQGTRTRRPGGATG